jgi:hypothetical protein
MAMNWCKCGRIVLAGRYLCNECMVKVRWAQVKANKQKVIKENETKKENPCGV